MLPNRVVRWMLVSLTLLLAFAPFATASAGGKPVRGPVPLDSPRLITGACAFSVLLEATDYNVYFKMFTYGSTTRFLVTGASKARLTNVDTGKSLDVMFNAQVTELDNSDGSFTVAVHGPGVYVNLPGPGLPPLAYLRGNGSSTWVDGIPTNVQYTGNLQDLCAALAP
jgi:hypothetical protein